MSDYTLEELNEAFAKVPEEVQDVIVSVDTAKKIGEIGKKNNLNINQQGILADRIGELMVGLAHPETFLDTVRKELGVSLDQAGQIVKDVNLQIFFPIREALKRVHAETAPASKAESAPLVENLAPQGQVSDANIQKAAEPLPVPDNNAIIINKEVTAKSAGETQKLFNEKMGKLFRLPKEEVELKTTPNKPKLVEPSDVDTDLDPYREAIN